MNSLNLMDEILLDRLNVYYLPKLYAVSYVPLKKYVRCLSICKRK